MDYYGKALLGKVDEVPGLFYVATQCEHLCWFPLSPGDSFIVKAGREQGEEFAGTPIPRDPRSLLMAYARAVVAIVALVSLAVFLIQAAAGNSVEIGLLLVALLAGGMVAGSFRLTRAKPARALELAALAGVPAEEVARRFVAEGEIAAFLAQHQPKVHSPPPGG